MDWISIVVSTALFAGMTYFFYRKCQNAILASSIRTLTKWLRWRHGSFLFLWIVAAVYLFIHPDSSGMVLALWWGLLLLAIVIEAVHFIRTFSPEIMSMRLAKEQTAMEPAPRS